MSIKSNRTASTFACIKKAASSLWISQTNRRFNTLACTPIVHLTLLKLISKNTRNYIIITNTIAVYVFIWIFLLTQIWINNNRVFFSLSSPKTSMWIRIFMLQIFLLESQLYQIILDYFKSFIYITDPPTAIIHDFKWYPEQYVLWMCFFLFILITI